MRILPVSILCLLLMLSSNAQGGPPYFSLVNDQWGNQSKVQAYLDDGMPPFPPGPDPWNVSNYANIPTPNFTTDSLLLGLNAGHIAQIGIGPDEQSVTSTAGGIILDNPGSDDLIEMGVNSFANYYVYDPDDLLNVDDHCSNLLKVSCTGTFLRCHASFNATFSINGVLVAQTVVYPNGDVYLEGNGIHVPTSIYAGTIITTLTNPSDPFSAVDNTAISILVDQHLIDLPLGSDLSVSASLTAYPMFEPTAQGLAVFYVDVIGGTIY